MRYEMKCPECDYNMAYKDSKTTLGTGNKPYNWTQYVCKRDDIWIELEVPKEDKD